MIANIGPTRKIYAHQFVCRDEGCPEFAVLVANERRKRAAE